MSVPLSPLYSGPGLSGATPCGPQLKTTGEGGKAGHQSGGLREVQLDGSERAGVPSLNEVLLTLHPPRSQVGVT